MPSESHGTHDRTPAEREEALVRKAASNAEVESAAGVGDAPQIDAKAIADRMMDVRACEALWAAALAPKEGAPTADLGRAVGAWAEIAEHYRCAMLAAETAINSTPMPVSDGQTSLIWKRFSEAATGLHTARMDMIHKYGPAFLNSGPIGPAALPAQAAEPVAVKALLTRALSLIDAMFTNDPNEPVSDAGHTALDLWRHEADALRSALSGAAPQAGEDVPKHIAFRRAALARAAELDGSAFAGDLDPLDDDDTVEGLARSVAIVLAGYDWTVDPTSGRIVACVAADQGFAATTLVVDDATRRAVSAPPVEGWRPTHRHKKRGSEYQVIAQGRLQVDGYLDMERVTIYRARNGETWVRPDYEFNDGRFEALPTPPDSQGGEDA